MGGRPRTFRSGNIGVSRALGACVSAGVIVCGALYLFAHAFYFNRQAYGDFFVRLPFTLELIVASVIIALALALACKLLSRVRRVQLGGIVAALLFFCACIPVFWSTAMAQLVFSIWGVHVFSYHVQLPTIGPGNDTFNIRDRLSHLVLPAMVLALVQAGAYVDAMRCGISARRLFATFALLLPTIVSAELVVELFFAWPGVGRAFYSPAVAHHTSFMVAFLLIIGMGIIILRTAAARLVHPHDLDAAEVLQPL